MARRLPPHLPAAQLQSSSPPGSSSTPTTPASLTTPRSPPPTRAHPVLRTRGQRDAVLLPAPPLQDNLQNTTYETSEQDSVKYTHPVN
ncbi:hypothetical protein ARMGADRAFT_1004409 [Armillaria gallica]|uniref:PRMT5 arginine-N-methyltransferase domain-containing protein n=1 Tax=Armillaria gallica TaxID=47427 RepID=A0A2H3EC51_ARMGA|nr:hypothetical protein ARMGADRAFT_1004409 [Armillaria gallica]